MPTRYSRETGVKDSRWRVFMVLLRARSRCESPLLRFLSLLRDPAAYCNTSRKRQSGVERQRGWGTTSLAHNRQIAVSRSPVISASSAQTTIRMAEKTEGAVGKNIVPEDASEFTIAADLTLYANPLRCLNASKPPKPAEKIAAESGEIIAADLVKYGSPLDDKPGNK